MMDKERKRERGLERFLEKGLDRVSKREGLSEKERGTK